ncbi:MAG: hypothetical protein AAB416_02050 [Patescibacteria group bacterium]
MEQVQFEKLSNQISLLQSSQEHLAGKIGFLTDQHKKLAEQVDGMQRIQAQLFGKISSLDESAVKIDFFDERHDQVISHIDDFINLHTRLDQELLALRSKYDRLEERIEVMEQAG